MLLKTEQSSQMNGLRITTRRNANHTGTRANHSSARGSTTIGASTDTA